MLVLARKPGEKVVVNKNVIVEVLQVLGNKVRLGFKAPEDVSIHRYEVWQSIQREQAKQDEGQDAHDGAAGAA